MPTPLVAFVAGATGYTGQHVVAALRARGARLVAHVRPGSSAAAGWRARFEASGAEVDETPWEPAAVRATLARVRPDHVFALLGALALVGLGKVRDASGSLSGRELADGLVALALAEREGHLMTGVARLRSAAAGAR